MKTLILTVLTLVATCPYAAADDSQDVAAVVRAAVSEVVSVLKDKERTHQERRDRVIEIIEPLVDFRLLAMLSLGRKHWTRIDSKQKETFTNLFVETLKMSYFEKLRLFTDEVVEFAEPVALRTSKSPKFRVLTYIISKGDRIRVAYMLTQRKGTWRAFDFEIEGVSVRKSYGSQYNDFLREKSFEKLLETMREKVKTAKEKDSKAREQDN